MGWIGVLLAIWVGVSGAASGLDRVYRIRFDPSVDVSQVARDFEGLPGWVEYAEPDRRMEVQ